MNTTRQRLARVVDRLTYAVLLRAAAFTSRPTLLRRLLVGVAGLVVAGLGVWGWMLSSGQDASRADDPPALVYLVITLFSAGVDVEFAPWPLALARVLAPLITVTFLIDVVLQFSVDRTRRLLALRSRDHVVLIGSLRRTHALVPDAAVAEESWWRRVGLHVGLARPSTVPTLQVSDEPSPTALPNVIHLEEGGVVSEVIESTNALQAASVVVATGSDARSLRYLSAMTDGGGPVPPIIVEMEDPVLALQVAVQAAIESPKADIEVVSLPLAYSGLIVPQMVDAVACGLGFDPSRPLRDQGARISEIEATVAEGGPTVRPVVLIGDGPVAKTVRADLVRELKALERSIGSLLEVPTARLAPGVNAASRPGAGGRFPAHGSLEELQRWLEGQPPALVLVDHIDDEATTRDFVGAVHRLPRSDVWVVADEALIRPTTKQQTKVHAVGHASLVAEGALVGPFAFVARAHERLWAERGQPSLGEPWTAVSVRAAVSALSAAGWRVEVDGHLDAQASGLGMAGWRVAKEAGLTDPEPLLELLAERRIRLRAPDAAASDTPDSEGVDRDSARVDR